MSGFIKRLFSKPKPETLHISFGEVSGYLDGKEKEAALIVENAADRAREVCAAEMGELLEKVREIGEKEVRPDSHPHPKVRTVAEKSIPRFVAAMEKALSRELTSDPELLYDDIVALISSLAEAMKKHARYIVVVFPDEMKSVKSSLDAIGNSLNSMTEEVKAAVSIRTWVSRARQVYEDTGVQTAEYERLGREISSLRDDLSGIESKIGSLDARISSIMSGEEYRSCISSKNRLSALYEEKEEIVSGFEHLRSSCMNVFRKSAYIADKEGHTALAGDINRIMDLLSSPCDMTADAAEIYPGIYSSISHIAQEHDGILKNRDEAELFSSGAFFPARLGDIISEYRRVNEEIRLEKQALDASGLGVKLKKLGMEKEKLAVSSEDMEQRIREAESRRSEISSGLPARKEDLRSALAAIEGADIELDAGEEDSSQ